MPAHTRAWDVRADQAFRGRGVGSINQSTSPLATVGIRFPLPSWLGVRLDIDQSNFPLPSWEGGIDLRATWLPYFVYT